MNDIKVFSLLEVLKSIQKTLFDRYTSSFWVKAEINKLNFYKQSGHCYPELVEKRDEKVVAQVKANLWKDDYSAINNKFLRVLKEPLKDGIKVLFLGRITFDPVYGLSLQILDIDPNYTLGDLEKEKQETIKKLQNDGIFNQNKELILAQLPQRIAIISVETSKGYADFIKVLDGNPWNYKFFHFLFPSLLQGEKAVDGILGQLKKIKKVKEHFDAVAIIRGGGGDIGLSCYNIYTLSREIALFPLPILTGIGHVTNETVAETISFFNAITPTKLAEYLIQKFHNYSVPVQKAEETITDRSKRIIENEKKRFQSEVKLFRSASRSIVLNKQNDVKELKTSLLQQSKFIFKKVHEDLLTIEFSIKKNSINVCNVWNQLIRQFAISLRKDVISQLYHFNLIISQNFQQITRGSTTFIIYKKEQLIRTGEKLTRQPLSILKSNANELKNMEINLIHLSPENVLKRGYSITLLNNKAVKNINQVSSGDIIKTVLLEGHVVSTVNSTDKFK